MDELLQELADAELGKQVMVTAGAAEMKFNTVVSFCKHKLCVLRIKVYRTSRCNDISITSATLYYFRATFYVDINLKNVALFVIMYLIQ